MKQTVSKYDFERAFHDCGRADQFSYEALGLLYDFFEEIDESCNTETELDVIAICCEFCESDADEISDNYSIDVDKVEEYLQENTMLVGITESGNYVYQAF